MRKHRTDKTIADFKEQKNLVNRLSDTKKIDFFNTAITKCNGDQKGIHRLLRKLTNKPTKPVYPDAPDDKVLANQFSDFFESKIDAINEGFPSETSPVHSELPVESPKCMFRSFAPLTQEELRKYILQSPTKSCQLDLIPTFLLKECIDTVPPILTETVNR